MVDASARSAAAASGSDLFLIDTHAHLDYPDFHQDFSEILHRAESEGVARIISIGTSIESSRRAVNLAEKYAQIYAVIGIHPTAVPEAGEDIMTPLRDLAKSPRVVAIGETGLDFHRLPGQRVKEPLVEGLGPAPSNDPTKISAETRDGAIKSAQSDLFKQQLELACELGLNVVVHQREAWEDTLKIVKEYSAEVRCVFHCFGDSLSRAMEVVSLGHMVSFTGIVTFKNAPVVRDVALGVPEESYMVETDCPYLAPVPHRGKRCEPMHTRIVAETIAGLRGQTVGEVASQTTRNAERFFKFHD